MAHGRVLYEGPSAFDGRPIVAIVTNLGRKSKNGKTGDMAQTFIMPRRMFGAGGMGPTSSVCGSCLHRPRREGGIGSCYVDVSRTPASVWRRWTEGGYRPFDPTPGGIDARRAAAKPVRLGAWGDPAAVPFEAWAPLLALAPGRTGYTHAWKTCDPRYRGILMASCDTPGEALQARALGWRPFRVRTEGAPLMDGEFECPASAAGGHRMDCARCGACWGADDTATRAFPGIAVHGAPNRAQAWRTWAAKTTTTAEVQL